MDQLPLSIRVQKLKETMFAEERFMSIEQAKIVTDVYRDNPGLPRNMLRALALKEALGRIEIRITQGERIVGNRTTGVRAGVIFPESGLSWVDREIETLPTRPQDPFQVRQEDVAAFKNEIFPFWKDKTLEDILDERIGPEMRAIGKVAKINQTDHAQGHICPDTERWLQSGPKGLIDVAKADRERHPDNAGFYDGLILALEGAQIFMRRYAALAQEMAETSVQKEELLEIARVCDALAERAPQSFREAVQASWFLYVILQMESNASSFSPGRMDQYLYPFYEKDIASGALSNEQALELVECLFLKFNQIVYLRSSSSAKYFAGFPIGFNVAIGGQNEVGEPAENELTFLFLRAQEHLLLPQPNLSARVFSHSSEHFLTRCAEVVGKGSGMPQFFNDEAVIPALKSKGISDEDAKNYAIVGCVELTTMGNNLGWSDAAMFNLVKALELALNDGVCTLSGKQMGAHTGTIEDFETYEDVLRALDTQVDFFFERMIRCCEVVEKAHAELLPSPFLSSVIDDCMGTGIDVTAGGAHYNLSGIQAIQCANVADSLAALKTLVYDEKLVDRRELHAALVNNFENAELLRLRLLNKAPKYGNDVDWVDAIAFDWAKAFAERLSRYTNVRGGPYQMGLYTVSAHVPMGQNVGATPDGRLAKEPLADGGMSPVYGRDSHGPTAVLKSVARVKSEYGSNGTLLNMKFLPSLFKTEIGVAKFVRLLRAFIELKIIHVQFNVVNRADLLAAQERPELYRSLTIRVAGYTAYFTELAPDLQREIIERTEYADI
ncbi:MAG: formate C-acetyltransferase/glycerol dehydratase family glycyl radical enzyme [Clostridiales bacterium]|nr:formate C-acetyltransferase/glycerol dehydratase family glycyl radical enzyme [Clostridiales bacterium]